MRTCPVIEPGRSAPARTSFAFAFVFCCRAQMTRSCAAVMNHSKNYPSVTLTRRKGILEFWSFRILEFGNLEFWDSGVLEFWNSGVLEFWNSGILEFSNFVIFEF